MSPNLSRAQILNFLQCPRRFWLEQYHPEHENDVDAMDTALDADEEAVASAHAALSGDHVHLINSRLGLRSAIEQTSSLISDGAVVLNATLERDGISAQIDVLDWSGDVPLAIITTAAHEVSQRHIQASALHAWIISGLNLPEHGLIVGLRRQAANDEPALAAQFDLVDVSEAARPQIEPLGAAIEQARLLHAALGEPPAEIGSHCQSAGYPCPFLAYCELGIE